MCGRYEVLSWDTLQLIELCTFKKKSCWGILSSAEVLSCVKTEISDKVTNILILGSSTFSQFINTKSVPRVVLQAI